MASHSSRVFAIGFWQRICFPARAAAITASGWYGCGVQISTASTPAPPPPGGLSVGDLVLAIAVALFAGGFVGNLFASRRAAGNRLDVYRIIDQRLAEERTSLETEASSRR